jgi:hypothetical protein
LTNTDESATVEKKKPKIFAKVTGHAHLHVAVFDVMGAAKIAVRANWQMDH